MKVGAQVTSASPGISDEMAPCFVAWNLHAGLAMPEVDELLTIRKLPFHEALSMASSGDIQDLASIASLLGLQDKLNDGSFPVDLRAMILSAKS